MKKLKHNLFYFVTYFKILRNWNKLYLIFKKENEILKKNGFRRDWVGNSLGLGRIYTIINVPEEILEHDMAINPYVISKLGALNEIFLEMGIMDYLFPEFKRLSDASFLLILEINKEDLSSTKCVLSLLGTFGLIFGAWSLLSYLYRVGLFENISTFFSTYVF